MSLEPIDIGHGVSIEFVADPAGDGDAGLIETHPTPSGEVCRGAVFWIPWGNSPIWTLVSREPLTVEPSILCRLCGHHGFIREGSWVPA